MASVWSGLAVCISFAVVYLVVAFSLSFLDPDYLASDLISKGDFQKAEEVLNHSRTAFPTDPDVGYNLAIVYSETQRREAAVRELQAVLARKPHDQQAETFLRELMSDAENTDSTEASEPSAAPAPQVHR